jgi:hypothetical protein
MKPATDIKDWFRDLNLALRDITGLFRHVAKRHIHIAETNFYIAIRPPHPARLRHHAAIWDNFLATNAHG